MLQIGPNFPHAWTFHHFTVPLTFPSNHSHKQRQHEGELDLWLQEAYIWQMLVLVIFHTLSWLISLEQFIPITSSTHTLALFPNTPDLHTAFIYHLHISHSQNLQSYINIFTHLVVTIGKKLHISIYGM